MCGAFGMIFQLRQDLGSMDAPCHQTHYMYAHLLLHPCHTTKTMAMYNKKPQVFINSFVHTNCKVTATTEERELLCLRPSPFYLIAIVQDLNIADYSIKNSHIIINKS